jgi:hypothetical protein
LFPEKQDTEKNTVAYTPVAGQRPQDKKYTRGVAE